MYKVGDRVVYTGNINALSGSGAVWYVIKDVSPIDGKEVLLNPAPRVEFWVPVHDIRLYAEYGPKPLETSHDWSEKKDTNPKDAAASTRLSLSVFPATARAYGALAFTEGDYKYRAYNYRVAGVLASVYYDAVNRHMDKWYNGEECDPVTKVPHLASALAGIAVLIDSVVCGVMKDDRPPQAPVAEMLADMEKLVAHLQENFPNREGRYTQKELEQ